MISLINPGIRQIPSGGGAQALPVPTLVQHVASAANPVGISGFLSGHTGGDNYKIPIPNAVRAGNVLLLETTYPHGSTPTVTDNNGNSWPGSPAASADDGAGNYVLAIYVLPNANAGQTTINVSFGADTTPFHYRVSEFNNIATTSPVNGTSSAAGVIGSALASGSFTPGNNDAAGGNLIWSCFTLSRIANSNPTGWSPSGSFTLLDGDITWKTNQGFPHASEYLIQTAAASINPGITSTGDTTDHFNCVSVALKVASAGSPKPAGIHIDKILHFTNNAPAGGTQILQIPSVGNLRVLATANAPGTTNITGVVDSEGNTWNAVPNGGVSPQMFYWNAASPNNALTVTVSFSGTPTFSFRYWDISQAAASPFDTSANVGGTSANGVSSIAHQPNITPVATTGLILAIMGIGQGPGLGVTSPSGAIWDLCTYDFEIDIDLMENADAVGHLYNASASLENWTWTITNNASNSVDSTAAAFH